MTNPLRVLFVEDSEDDVAFLVRELRRGEYEPSYLRVDTPQAMGAALRDQTWEVVICDFAMPKFSQPAALKLLHDSGLDLPFLIVSGTIGEDKAVEAMKSGAHDYIMKADLARLVPAIEREIREAAERARRRRAEKDLHRAELRRRQAAQTGRERERKRLAEELHDDTMAALAGSAVELSILAGEAKQTAGGVELAQALTELRRRIAATETRLREIVQGIYPSIITNLGLVSAIRSYFEDVAARPISNLYPLELQFSETGFGEDRLPEEVEIALYRVVQLGLTNTIKHAQARSLTLDVVWSDSEVALRMQDDGIGFDAGTLKNTPDSGHYGLANLRDRIESVGGVSEMNSQPGAGTTLWARIHVDAGERRPDKVNSTRFVAGVESAVVDSTA